MCKEAVLDVLSRAGRDPGFIAQLTYDGPKALKSYSLSRRERAALLAGDLPQLEAYVGKLEGAQAAWPRCRLQQEKW
jgi:hypothetical protein